MVDCIFPGADCTRRRTDGTCQHGCVVKAIEDKEHFQRLVKDAILQLDEKDDEIERLRLYAELLQRGLSESEARGTAWPENTIEKKGAPRLPDIDSLEAREAWAEIEQKGEKR